MKGEKLHYHTNESSSNKMVESITPFSKEKDYTKNIKQILLTIKNETEKERIMYKIFPVFLDITKNQAYCSDIYNKCRNYFKHVKETDDKVYFVRYVKEKGLYVSSLFSQLENILKKMQTEFNEYNLEKLLSLLERFSIDSAVYLDNLSTVVSKDYEQKRIPKNHWILKCIDNVSASLIERDLVEYKIVHEGKIELSLTVIDRFRRRYGGDLRPLHEAVVKLICEKKAVKFPLKRHRKNYLEDARMLFKNLVNYVPDMQEDVPFGVGNKFPASGNLFAMNFAGKKLVVIPRQDEYDTINVLTDYFSEKQRMTARRKDQALSPIQFFRFPDFAAHLLNYLNLKGKPITSTELREAVYSNLKECTQFKTTIAFSTYKILNGKRILDISAGWGGSFSSYFDF